MSRQIVVGVAIAVITAITLAAIGLRPDGSARDEPGPTFEPVTEQPVTPASATVCNSTAGTCPLFDVVPVGGSCVCIDDFGLQFPGTAN
ncbi:MAG: hypothetical protein AAFZ07_27265 [Actinomycetota bacterium]